MDAGIGASVLRTEDVRLLTGQGCFADDVSLPGQAHAAMVRSPHPHAGIKSYDTEAAAAAPGVIAVLTGEDFHADGLNRIPHVPMHSSPPDTLFENRDGSEFFPPTIIHCPPTRCAMSARRSPWWWSRWRSIPTPARSRSCAIPPSTMSGAPSTRS